MRAPGDQDQRQERVRVAYRDNDERPVAIKSRFAPGNLARVNQNIRLQA